MLLKEIYRKIISKSRPTAKNQSVNFLENKYRKRLLIICAVIIACASLSQTGTQAKLRQEILLNNEIFSTGNELQQIITNNKIFKEINIEINPNIPSIYPIAGRISGMFGNRANPFGKKKSEIHRGIDIAAPIGTPINVAGDGMVIFVGKMNGYGNIVIVDHGNGLTTRYGHLSQFTSLMGQQIKRGDVVGKVGSTGRSTGAHLHYEVRIYNQAVDPFRYLPLNK